MHRTRRIALCGAVMLSTPASCHNPGLGCNMSLILPTEASEHPVLLYLCCRCVPLRLGRPSTDIEVLLNTDAASRWDGRNTPSTARVVRRGRACPELCLPIRHRTISYMFACKDDATWTAPLRDLIVICLPWKQVRWQLDARARAIFNPGWSICHLRTSWCVERGFLINLPTRRYDPVVLPL